VRPLTASPGEVGGVETMTGQLNERIGVAPFPRAVVVTAGALGERVERRAQRRAPHRVEEAPDENSAALSGPHVQSAGLDVLELLRLERLNVVRVAGVGTISAKAAQSMGHRLIQQWPFLELSSSRRLLKRSCRPGHQREMGETQLPLLDRCDALSESGRLRSNGYRSRRPRGGHPALQAHPLRRADAALPLLFFGVGEGTGDCRKLQLDSVDDLAQSHQFTSQDGWGY
jgi:hypothetical protein